MNDPRGDDARNLPRPSGYGPASPQPGPGGFPYPPPMVVYNVAAPTKSPGGAALLAALFGPLGMLYATVPGALVMFAANLVVGVIGALTCGLGLVFLLFTWIGGIAWAYVAADAHNAKLLAPPQHQQWPYPPTPPSY